ncbi:MAG: DUF92 domain-containing protein [Spirochaetota bacterium]
MTTGHILIAVLLNAAAAVGAHRRRAVTPTGAVAGFVVGAGILAFGGWTSWVLLMTFFGSSTVLSRVKSSSKDAVSKLHEKGSRRDHVQVLANAGVGLVMSAAYAATGMPMFLVAVAVSFAAANADTWASEIGVLSASAPVSILGAGRLPRGTSGGVSLLGFAASAIGSGLIALVFSLFYGFTAGWGAGVLLIFAVITAGGFLGSLIDSILGAAVQAQYTDSATGAPTERRHSPHAEAPNTLRRGFASVTNDAVNAISCLLSTAAGASLYLLAG